LNFLGRGSPKRASWRDVNRQSLEPKNHIRRRVVFFAAVSGLAIAWVFGRSPPSYREASSDLPVTAPSAIQGRVVRVSDGDTLVVLRDEGGRPRQVKIRLLGIDAPETSQPFGRVCRDNLARYVAGKDVAVEAGKLDRYGRTLGKIMMAGKDINLAQVEDGCAWHYKQYARDQAKADRDVYAKAEIIARAAKKNLWKDGSSRPPWEYRRQNRR